MSNQLINQFKRIESIKERLEESILELAKRQVNIAQEVHQEILGCRNPKLYHDYLKIQEYSGRIERWWSRRGEPDEEVNCGETFEVDFDILNGRDDDCRHSVRVECLLKKKKLDAADLNAKLAHRKQLKAELARIDAVLKGIE